MIKIIFGVCLALFILAYSNEMKQFAVEIGMREQMVEYLRSWGDSCSAKPVGLKCSNSDPI